MSRLYRWWGLQLLTTTAFALIVAALYYSVADVDDAPGSLAFRATMLVAHFTALSAVTLGPSLAAIVLRAPAWIVIPLGALCSIGMSLALLIDTQVYQLYRFHIHAGIMNLLIGIERLTSTSYRRCFEITSAAQNRSRSTASGDRCSKRADAKRSF